MTPRARYDALSFDVVGALIDADRAMAAGLERAGVLHPAQISRLLEARQAAEWEILDELEVYEPYGDVLVESLLRAASRCGSVLARAAAESALGDPAGWPLHADVAPALARLAGRLRIALVTNLDRTVADAIAARLGVPVARVVAAPELEAYTSDPDPLLAVLHELALDEDRLLHVAGVPEFSLYTAEDLGVPAAFVDRAGAGLPEELGVAHRVHDLAALADALLEPAPRRPARKPRPVASPVARKQRRLTP